MKVFLIASMLSLAAGSADRSPPPPTAAELIRSAAEDGERNLLAWRRFAFQRRVIREELESDGTVSSRKESVSRISPRSEGEFDETLLSIDGRPATPKEVARHREDAPFSRHLDDLLQGRQGGLVAGYSFRDLLALPTYRMAGEEQVDGIPCLRLEIVPSDQRARGLPGKIARTAEGRIWLTQKGHHLMQGHITADEGVAHLLNLVNVREVEVSYRAAAVDEQVWLPQEIDLTIEIRLLFRTTRRRYRFEYTDYERRQELGEVSTE